MWIDIENASGIRQGSGPITSAVFWNATRRLDSAGSFSFSMPASDPNTNLLQHKMIARAWGFEDGVLKEYGSGAIDSIVIKPQANKPTLIEVSGDDLMRELVNTQLGSWVVAQWLEQKYLAGLKLFDFTNGVFLPNIVPYSTVQLEVDPLYMILVENTFSFNHITFTLGDVVNYNMGNLEARYLKSDRSGLQSLDLSDGTADYGKSFARSGTVSWQMPADWCKDTDGYYKVWFFLDNRPSPIQFTGFSTWNSIETYAAPRTVMQRAPANWSLELPTSGLPPVTNTGVIMQFSGDSILSALGKVAEQTGEHFALSLAGRRIRWIGSEQEDSGLRAISVSSADVDDYSLRILSISQISESFEFFTRAYPYGAGLSGNRLSLRDASDSAPAGYTMAEDAYGEWYLENDAAVLEYGRIDRPMDFPDISPLDVGPSAVVRAANGLLTRTFQHLRRACELQYAYTLSVAPTKHEILPGQTIRCIYHEWAGDYHSVSIDRVLWVMEVNQQIDVSGMRVVGLTVATVDKLPENSATMVTSAIQKAHIQRSLEIPETGLTDTRDGVVTKVDVVKGSVTNIRRVNPAADGRYKPEWITVKDGTVTLIEEYS